MFDYSIVIPTYRGSNIVVSTIKNLIKYFSVHPITFEICVIVDGYHEPTINKLLHLQNSTSLVRILVINKNLGLWAATLQGIKFSRGKYIITYDDDGEYPPEAVLALVKEHAKNKNLVLFGIPDIAPKKYNNLRRRLINFFLGQRLTSSLRLFPRSIIAETTPGWVYIDAYFSLKVKASLITRIAVPYNMGRKRMGSLKKIKLSLKGIFCYKRPLMISAAILLVLAASSIFFLNFNHLAFSIFLITFLITVLQLLRIRGLP